MPVDSTFQSCTGPDCTGTRLGEVSPVPNWPEGL
jgi:hypothetical protein